MAGARTLGVRARHRTPGSRLTEAVAGGAWGPTSRGSTGSSPPTSRRWHAGWRQDLAAGISGQVVKVQGGLVQLLQGDLVIEVRLCMWTLDAVGTEGLLQGRPPFFLNALRLGDRR